MKDEEQQQFFSKERSGLKKAGNLVDHCPTLLTVFDSLLPFCFCSKGKKEQRVHTTIQKREICDDDDDFSSDSAHATTMLKLRALLQILLLVLEEKFWWWFFMRWRQIRVVS